MAENIKKILRSLKKTASQLKSTHINNKRGPKYRWTVLTARMQSIEKQWKKFSTLHQELIEITPLCKKNSYSYFTNDEYSSVEDLYLRNKANLQNEMCLLLSHSSPKFMQFINSHISPSSQPQSSYMLISADSRTPLNNLPSIKLPKYSGGYEEWPSFHDQFDIDYQKEGFYSEASSLLDVNEVSIDEDSCEICLHVDINNENELRFVCLHCTDLYLCKACFDEGLHSHHYMVRVPKHRPSEEVSRVVTRLRTELAETARRGPAAPELERDVLELEQNVPQLEREEHDVSELEQDVPQMEHDELETEQNVAKQEPYVAEEEHKFEQEQAMPEQEHETHTSNFGPDDEEEIDVKLEQDLEVDPLSDQKDSKYDIIIKEESIQDAIDRRQSERHPVAASSATGGASPATGSHTKRAPRGCSEAGPSKLARRPGAAAADTRPGAGNSTDASTEDSLVRVISNKTSRSDAHGV